MQIIRHVSDDELRNLQLDSDQRYLQAKFSALAAWARTSTDKPDAFWEAQRADIHRRTVESEASSVRLIRSAWAPALALLVIATLLLVGAPPPTPVQVGANEPATDADQQLLIAVEQAVQSGVPDALAPASLLAEEISQETDFPHQFPSQGGSE